MPNAKSSRFSPKTLKFILKASKQKSPHWLEKHRDEYERLVRDPLQALARTLKEELSAAASGYHFPQKGIGRLRRGARSPSARGGAVYKSWIAYSASRPTGSRFDHNPNLFFLIQPTDPADSVLVAGGLYMPSSRQLKAVRTAIATDARPFDRLFASKEFARRFPGGFSPEKISSRPPRGFDPEHPRLAWLKLQAFFVWRSYTRREFASPGFAALVAADFRQILRLNELLEAAIRGAPLAPQARVPETSTDLLDRLGEIAPVRRPMDF